MSNAEQESEAPSRPRSRREDTGHRAARADLAERLAERPAHNADNLTRTAFYLAYWKTHPEVMWALLAHLVSRNAGYQMTDLGRHIERCQRGRRWLAQVGGRFGVAAVHVERTFGQLLRFLEAGNYLIFHDAYPQLAAYAAAKRAFLATGCPSAARVLDDLAELGVEPSIIGVWRAFFEEGARSGFFRDMSASERRAAPAVVHMALASVVNEQSYLEDRLLAPVGSAPRYVDAEMPFTLWFEAAAALGLTRLVFPVASREAPQRAASLLVHVLGARDGEPRRDPWWGVPSLLGGPSRPSFAVLRARIDIGRALYFGLFLADRERAEGVERWAVHAPAHTGERSVYDPKGYAPASRRPGLLSRALPRGPHPGWPGPPDAALPTWSTRFDEPVWGVEPLRADPFEGPLGWDAEVHSRRPLDEVMDPARLWVR